MSQITVAGSTSGTPEYMSPEQARGVELDARSDVYALGVLLYRVVAGRPPFLGRNPVAVASAHVTEPVKRLREVFPGVRIGRRLEELIYRCLEKQPERRHASARELRHELESILQEHEQEGVPTLADNLRTEDLLRAGWLGPGTGQGEVLPWSGKPSSAAGGEPAAPAVFTGGSLRGSSPEPGRPSPPPAAPTPQPVRGATPFPRPTPAPAPPDRTASDARGTIPFSPSAPGPLTGSPSPVAPVSDWDLAEHAPTELNTPRLELPRRRNPLPLVATALLLLLLGATAVLLVARPWPPLHLQVATTAGTPEIQQADGSWQPLAAVSAELGWGHTLRTGKEATAQVSDGRAWTGDLAGESRLALGFLGRLALEQGRFAVHGLPEQAARLRLEVGEARVLLEGAGPFAVERTDDGLEVANQAGKAEIQLDSGKIPVEPGRRVRYKRGEQPTYAPLAP
jgi:hypothetical protein